MKKKIDMLVRHFQPGKLSALPRTAYQLSLELRRFYSITINTNNEYLKSEMNLNGLLLKPHTGLSIEKILSDSDIIHFFGSLIGAYSLLRSVKQKKQSIIISPYTSKLGWCDISYLKFSDFFIDYRTKCLSNPLLGTIIPNFFLKKELNKADRIIVASIRQKLFYQKLVGSKVIRIPHGVDTTKFKPIQKEKARKKIGLNSSKSVIVYAGHDYIIRGIDTLIYATELILKKYPDVLLVLIINPTCSRSINFINKLALRLGSNVRVITKYVNNLEDYYNAADVISLPFRCSGELPPYPFTMLEAMACSKPVLTTRIGSIPEIISNKHNGLLVNNPNSYNELADSILYILKNDKFAENISKNARESIKEFDWRTVAKKIREVYENV